MNGPIWLKSTAKNALFSSCHLVGAINGFLNNCNSVMDEHDRRSVAQVPRNFPEKVRELLDARMRRRNEWDNPDRYFRKDFQCTQKTFAPIL